jgi:hypothetical protein
MSVERRVVGSTHCVHTSMPKQADSKRSGGRKTTSIKCGSMSILCTQGLEGRDEHRRCASRAAVWIEPLCGYSCSTPSRIRLQRTVHSSSGVR